MSDSKLISRNTEYLDGFAQGGPLQLWSSIINTFLLQRLETPDTEITHNPPKLRSSVSKNHNNVRY